MIFASVLRALRHWGVRFAARDRTVSTLNDDNRPALVHLVGAGPGDPDLLTLKALRCLRAADVIIRDRLVSPDVLALANGDAVVIEAGKTGFGPGWAQPDINAEIIRHAHTGARVVRLKSGDPVIFGRLDEEIDALEAAQIPYEIVSGVTSASAAAASIGQSLTRRGRNSSFRILTAHDVAGFASHDWQDLVCKDGVAAVYMGKRAASHLRGRLLMQGAAPDMPVSLIENASRPDEKVIATNLLELPEAMARDIGAGPALILLGLAPRNTALSQTQSMGISQSA